MRVDRTDLARDRGDSRLARPPRGQRRNTVRQKDVILSVGTVALILVAVGVVALTGRTEEFAAWAWDRHHNVLSWYIRPLFLLPFCYFAYKRNRGASRSRWLRSPPACS